MVALLTINVFVKVLPIRDEKDNSVALIVEQNNVLFTVREPRERVLPIPPTYDKFVADKLDIPDNAFIMIFVVYNLEVDMVVVDTASVDIVLARMVLVPNK